MMKSNIWIVLAFVLTIGNAMAQTPPLEFKFDYQLASLDSNEYLALTIMVSNTSSSSLYYWLQNWRLTNSIKGEENIYVKEPIGRGAISNSLFIFDKRLEKSRTHSSSTDVFYNDFVPSYYLLKFIAPGESFVINVVTRDAGLIDVIKSTPRNQLLAKYYYAFQTVSDNDSIFIEQENGSGIFYERDYLTIFFPTTNNSAHPSNLLYPLCEERELTRERLEFTSSGLNQARTLFSFE